MIKDAAGAVMAFDALNRLTSRTDKLSNYWTKFQGISWKRHVTIGGDGALFHVYDGDDTAIDLQNRAAKTIYTTPFLDQKTSYHDIGKNETRWYVLDALQSTRMLPDENGRTSQSYNYTAFGEPFGARQIQPQRFTFTGRERLSQYDNHLLSHRNRVFNNNRWLSRDPIGVAGGINLFAYVDNDPINNIDPSGLLTTEEFLYIWTPNQREEWLNSFNNAYGANINEAASQWCVPQNLLATVIANEMIDMGWQEGITDLLVGNSVGPAQITAETVFREGILTDAEMTALREAHSHVYPLQSLESYFRDYFLADNTNNYRFNIGIAASVP